MFYLDTSCTLTRRDSSLITSMPIMSSRYITKPSGFDLLNMNTAYVLPSCITASTSSLLNRPTGSIQKEIVTTLFESMLPTIIHTWNTIEVMKKRDESIDILCRSLSESTGKRRKSRSPRTIKRKTSKPDPDTPRDEIITQPDPLTLIWWSSPDEKVFIRFRNGNIYEGNVSGKCMHGEGRFQWADGTMYLGKFNDNAICGKGKIVWKDDTWYEGDFFSNLRHGKGLYVDARKQRCYSGNWFQGAKHGIGVMQYTNSDKKYDGQWFQNMRHGFGTEEYCTSSVYQGGWDRNVRDGLGFMIWPNHDLYIGDWKNSRMSGYGKYLWDIYFNNSMSLPVLSGYDGLWLKGERNEYGTLDMGLGLGFQYEGRFQSNKKHGKGKLVTNNGFIIKDMNLFTDDVLMGDVVLLPEMQTANMQKENINVLKNKAQVSLRSSFDDPESYYFKIGNDFIDLRRHIVDAVSKIGEDTQNTANIIEKHFKNNYTMDPCCISSISSPNHKKQLQLENRIKESRVEERIALEELVEFEDASLRRAIRCYEMELKMIYYKYATICNTDTIHFVPVLIRLFLWQFFFDCDIHEKGLTLAEIDIMFHENTEWLSRKPHNPFEAIQFWQFLHYMILVSNSLHCKRSHPMVKPDTLLASAFRKFMEEDVLPASGRCKGHLNKEQGSYIPMTRLYELYRAIGEPHTVRQFLCATRGNPTDADTEIQRPEIIDTQEEYVPRGKNCYIFGGDMIFDEDKSHFQTITSNYQESTSTPAKHLLFQFGNLSSRTILEEFAKIFSDQTIYGDGKVLNLDIPVTFFEFFEVVVVCAEESIRVREEESRWRGQFKPNITVIDKITGSSPFKESKVKKPKKLL